ncbi:MAG TPA: DUF2382 domain-containing protein [Trueperaceae bacterium]
MAKTVVAIYDRLEDSRSAIAELLSEGFDRDDVSVVANATGAELRRYFDEQGRYVESRGSEAGGSAASGAGVGAAVGGIGGLLVGLGLLSVPGVGPVLAAGPLAATLVGAGGVTGGLLGALTDAGVPEEEAHRYAEGVRRGGNLVVVNAPDGRAEMAATILDRHAAADVEARESNWRRQGWERHEHEAEPLTERQLAQEREHIEIPIVEEDIRVGKREVERGGVRARTYVRERPVDEQVELRDESVEVRRQRADRPLSAADGDAFRERSVEMHETDEEAVVSKEARVVEDVVIEKQARDRTEHVRDTVRRTEVEIEQLDDDIVDEDFSRYERTFRGHFKDSDISDRYAYDDVMPAYRFGYSLANDANCRDRRWDEIEPEARTRWEARNRGSWDDVRESVRHSWEVRNRDR